MSNFETPLSREEAILQNMLGAQNILEPPMSRTEDLLQQILENGPRPTPEEVRQIIEDYIEEHPEVLTVDTDQIVDKAVTKAKLADALLAYLLPAIEAADEGKVLKVDNGEPKWLTDSDSEYLLVTVTKTGNVYTADKTYNEIRPFAEKGKCVVFYNKVMYHVNSVDTNSISFKRQLNASTVEYNSNGEISYRILARINDMIITINSDNTISYSNQRALPTITVTVTNGETLSESNYNAIKTYITYTLPCYLLYSDKFLYVSKYNSAKTEFDFINEDEGIKAHIDANRLVTITEIPKDLFVTVTESSGTYSADYTYDEIKNAIDSGRNVIVIMNTRVYSLVRVQSASIQFKRYPQYDSSVDFNTNKNFLMWMTEFVLTFTTNSITYATYVHYIRVQITLTDGATLSESNYKAIQLQDDIPVHVVYNNKVVLLNKSSFTPTSGVGTAFEYINTVEGIKATIGTDKIVHITTI